MLSQNKKRLVVGISGASGAPIAVELLRALRKTPLWESHLVISDGAKRTIETEAHCRVEDILALSDCTYEFGNIGAAIASGTFRTEGMVIAPCSMKTLAGIANGYSENLLLRAADVTIKEGRKLVLVVRETPLSAVHLKNMLFLAQIGVVILPAVLSYYSSPRSVEDMTRQIVGKALDRFGVESEGFGRWGEA